MFVNMICAALTLTIKLSIELVTLVLKEHLFDIGDLQDREPILISKCGNLRVTFQYQAANRRMTVTVHEATEIPSKERGGAHSTQIRLLLLPTKKTRNKTKIKNGDTPVFEETFVFKVPGGMYLF